MDPKTEKPLFFDSVGTGSEFRLLTRALTFRFPKLNDTVRFDLYAEDPQKGILVKVLSQDLLPTDLSQVPSLPEPEIKLLKSATSTPELRVNVYAEGYTAGTAATFFKEAMKLAEALSTNDFPGHKQFTIYGIYSPSQQALGKATDLGLPVPERNSYLGLFFPYWNPFGRWYHVVYPTREQRFRNAIGQVPYDYPIALVDSSDYWGVGNFNEITAVPAKNHSFTYLLLHEFGHYFGLNEEYEGGGKTELAFAPDISEPWSQNITFHPKKGELKWESFVTSTTALPTPPSVWVGNGPFGAYKGGYADTIPLGASHKPGFNCTMESGTRFCPICKHAILEKIYFDSTN